MKMNEDTLKTKDLFGVNSYLLSFLMKENKKNLENAVFGMFTFGDAEKVMALIVDGFYSGFYERTTPLKSRDFKEKYGRLGDLHDAYLFYFLSEYYVLMKNHVNQKTIGSDIHRYKFLGKDVAAKLKDRYQESLGMSPFSFVSRHYPKKRHLDGYFSSLNGVSIASFYSAFMEHICSLQAEKNSSWALDARRKGQIGGIKKFLAEKNCSEYYSLISNGIWEGFYGHSFHEMKELFEKNHVSSSRLSNTLNGELLTYRVAMMDTVLDTLKNHFVNIPDVWVLFSKKIGDIVQAHFLEKQHIDPYTYLNDFYFHSNQLSLFDEEDNSSKTNYRRF